jgi:hypothetical protein
VVSYNFERKAGEPVSCAGARVLVLPAHFYHWQSVLLSPAVRSELLLTKEYSLFYNTLIE